MNDGCDREIKIALKNSSVFMHVPFNIRLSLFVKEKWINELIYLEFRNLLWTKLFLWIVS